MMEHLTQMELFHSAVSGAALALVLALWSRVRTLNELVDALSKVVMK